MWGGTKEESEACRLGLEAPLGTKTMITILNNSIQGILTFERDIKQSHVLIGRAKIAMGKTTTAKQLRQQQQVKWR